MGNEDAVRDSLLIRGGFATLLSFLLGSTMWSATHPDDGSAQLVFLSSLAFGLVAAYGLTRPTMMSLPKRATWMLILTVLWAVLAFQEPTAHYMIVALFALYLYRLPLWWGVAATAVVMLLGSGIGVVVMGSDVSVVVGPVMAGLVAIAVAVIVEEVFMVGEDRRELIDELIFTRSQLAESEREAGVVAERQRVAHEIHDTVAQGLSSIQMLLYAAERDIPDDSPARDRIEVARKVAAENLRDTRAIIAALQPRALQGGTLADALRRLATASHENVPGLSVEVTVGHRSDSGALALGTLEVSLPIMVKSVLLRIAQSAMANVRHHSGATTAQITVVADLSAGLVEMEVIDDGRGFDVPGALVGASGRAQGGHIGLMTMRQRAASIGGTVEFGSAPGRGTVVRTSAPLEGHRLESQHP
ncbi:MAG TPA: sensor histidine kinase [Candidatus Corynebacterium avicola]|uniref:Sensor histidine kinase n=1 Tax=Candidatus Corynebacterium avicola TaxID=2838527 RepID=A0A9D1RS08_9CORY|nr:sensor histidine kinase [Candidatus Corynebacterium avicola]